MDANAAALPRKRRRPALACEQCRRRKIRCNRKVPCDHCARSKGEACNYVLDDYPAGTGKSQRVAIDQTTRSPNTSPTTNGESPAYLVDLDLPGSGVFDARDTHFAVPSQPITRPMEDQSQVGRTDSTTTLEGPQSALAIEPLMDRVQHLEQRLSDAVKSQSSASATNSSPGPDMAMSIRGKFSKTRFFGQSHWMNGTDQFRKILTVLQRSEGDEKSEIRSLLEKCKSLARAVKAGEIIHQPLHSNCYDYVPSRKISDQLVQAYLRTFESVYRVLHVPTFLREYNQYWNDPRSASQAFVMKLLLVMAIGTGFSPDHNDSTLLRSSSSQWIYTAQSWLSSPFEKSRINLPGLQVHCLLLLARQTNAVGGDLIWISAGSLLRTAMYMGLHLDPCHSPKLSFFDAELRRRLWATVLEIAVQSSMDSGGLPLITCQDFDCKPPSNIDDMQMNDLVKIGATAKPLEQFTQTSVQIALMKSLPIRLEVAKFVNDFRSDSSYEETLRLGAELSSACQANSLLFRSFRTDQAHPSAFQVKLLDFLTHRFLLALHHPFAIKARSNPTFYFSLKVCLETSLFLLSHPPRSIDARDIEDDYTRLRLLGAGLFRDVPLQAAITICAELINQLDEDKSSFTSASNLLSRKELRKAIEDYVDLTASRIKAGETNVKGHVFFSCLLAQVDAMQAGTSVDQGISHALRKSLEVCYRLLRSRTDEAPTAQPEAETSADRPLDVVGAEDQQDWFRGDDMMRDLGLDLDVWLSSNPMSTGGGW